jgi:hypothetical protein
MSEKPQFWVITAEMGYGHQRAVEPFRTVANGGVVDIGKSESSSAIERRLWKRLLYLYTFISRVKKIPLVGEKLFSILDFFLEIPPLYPIKKRSIPSIQVRMLDAFVRLGLCSGVLKKMKENPLPVLTSFYAPAIAADRAGINPLYCIVCDADLSRAWVAPDPVKSRIHYCAPCGRASKRLKTYGVPQERIHLTGFPLPEELLGGKNLTTLKTNLRSRLIRLDPESIFHNSFGTSVDKFLGKCESVMPFERIPTISFSIGGAGAQIDIVELFMKSLSKMIITRSIRVNLMAGTHSEVAKTFNSLIKSNFSTCNNVKVISAPDFGSYYTVFNKELHNTDILWTKPSELSFYSALGLPILMAPAIGSQEKHNRRWLFEMHAGIDQEDPDCADEWLTDWLDKGRFAEAAWSGFLKTRKLGVYKIQQLLNGTEEIWDDFPK